MLLTAKIKGRVQNVGFRYFVQERARELALSGYVRNLADGSVYVVAEGPMEALRELEALLRRGPSAARVESVSVQWDEAANEQLTARFEVRH
ncbi:MAG TPA: acylphosphatase [Chloroflexia bacterium]|nr:acylphosphatase [Chloroflexia bacterium]